MNLYGSLLESYTSDISKLKSEIKDLEKELSPLYEEEDEDYQDEIDILDAEIFDLKNECKNFEEARDLIISGKKCMLKQLFTQEADLTAQYLNFSPELKDSDEYKKVDKELQQTRMLIKDTRYQLEIYE